MRRWRSRWLAAIAAIVLTGCAGPGTRSTWYAPGSEPGFQIVSRGAGLPHSGQWRSQLASADLNLDGYPDLVAPAARKGSGRPQIFLGQADGSWAGWKQAVLPRN